MRVERCFGFIDLCGFTAFADRHGDDQVVLVLAELRRTLREVAARRGVRIVKWLGDGAMLSSTMVDAVVGLTVEVAARMNEAAPLLPIRAGLASGPVIMFEGDDYIGYPVHVAARLCDQAQPHQLLATIDVAAARPAWVGAEPATSVVVRGLSREVATRAMFLRDPGPHAVIDPTCGPGSQWSPALVRPMASTSALTPVLAPSSSDLLHPSSSHRLRWSHLWKDRQHRHTKERDERFLCCRRRWRRGRRRSAVIRSVDRARPRRSRRHRGLRGPWRDT